MARIVQKRDDGKYVYRRWIAEYTGKRIREINQKVEEGDVVSLTDDERALIFINDEIGNLGKALSVLSRKKEVLVPSIECQEILDLYKETREKLDVLQLALRQSGCPTSDPLGIMQWIKQIADPA